MKSSRGKAHKVFQFNSPSPNTFYSLHIYAPLPILPN